MSAFSRVKTLQTKRGSSLQATVVCAEETAG
jgi:hypothetical protein